MNYNDISKSELIEMVEALEISIFEMGEVLTKERERVAELEYEVRQYEAEEYDRQMDDYNEAEYG